MFLSDFWDLPLKTIDQKSGYEISTKKNCLSLPQLRKNLNFFKLSFYNFKTWVWSSLHHFNTVTVTNSPTLYIQDISFLEDQIPATNFNTYICVIDQAYETKAGYPERARSGMPTCWFSHMIKCNSVTRQGSWEVIWGSRLPNAKVRALASYQCGSGLNPGINNIIGIRFCC